MSAAGDSRMRKVQALRDAVVAYVDEEIRKSECEIVFLRAVLDGRGVSSAGAGNLLKVADIVEAEISDYLDTE